MPRKNSITAKTKNASGGSAAAGGMNLHARVATLSAVHLLAGRDLHWLKELVSDSLLEISFETNGPGDDLRFLLKNREVVEAQVKKGLSRGPDLWTSLESLARGLSEQLIAYGVLIVDGDASQTIRSGLARGIRRLGEGRTDSLDDLSAELKERLENAGLAVDVVCSRLRIVTVHCADNDDASEQAARSELTRICATEYEASAAWQAIQLSAHGLIERKGRWTADTLTRVLKSAGITLHAVPAAPVTGIRSGPVWPHLDGVSTYRGHIQSFRHHYLFSAQDSPQPFGGREAEYKRLDDWLSDDRAPNRFLISAPTARGKSALVVQWTEGLASDATWATIFVPISLRFGTDRPTVFYALLAAQLAGLLGTAIGPQLTDLVAHYQGACIDLLSQAAQASRRLLIVIDGLDEAQGAGFNATVLLPTLPSTIKILVTAREQAGDRSNGGWLRRLGWESKACAETEDLSILDRTAVAPILNSIGLSREVEDDALVLRLMNLTDGEPLLLALYAEDLRDIARGGDQINAAVLDGLSPGFAAYFSRAFDMFSLVGDTDSQDVVDTTLAILALALGPLEAPHLTDLVCQIAGFARPIVSDRFVKPLRRFIAGDGRADHGYVLNHPKLAEYLREQRFDSTALRTVENAFVAWGRRVAEGLNSNPSAVAPPYVLRNHVQHLKQVGAITLDDVESLLTDGWRLAWHSIDKDYVGYAESLLAATSAMNPSLTYRSQETRALRLRWKLALFGSSVRSQGVSIPAELLERALTEQMITLPQALNMVELQPEENQLGYLLAIAAHLPPQHCDQLLCKVLRAENTANCHQQLAQLIPHLDSANREIIIGKVLSWLPTEEGARHRAAIIAAIAPVLDSAQLEQLLSRYILTPQANDTHSAIGSMNQVIDLLRTRGNIELAELLVTLSLLWTDALTDALLAAEALVRLAPVSASGPLIARAGRVKPPIQAARAAMAPNVEKWDSSARYHLARLTSAETALSVIELDQESSETYTTQLMALLSPFLSSEHEAIDILIKIAPIVRADARQALVALIQQLVMGLPTANNRTHALMQLAESATLPLRKSVVEQAFGFARQIEDEHLRGLALIQLFSTIDMQQHEQELGALFSDILKVRYVLERGELFLRLFCIRPSDEELADDALRAMLQAYDRANSTNILLREISNFPHHMRDRVFRACWERIHTRTDTFFSFQLGTAARFATEFWSSEELDFARSQLAILEPDLRMRLLIDLMPVAVRLNAHDLVEAAIATVSDVAEIDLYYVIMAIKHLPSDDRAHFPFSQVWFRAFNSDHANMDILVDTFAFLTHQQQTGAWSGLVARARIASGAGRLLAKLSSLSTGAAERATLFEAAIAACASEKPDARMTQLVDILSVCITKEESWRILDLMTDHSITSRRHILQALQNSAPEMAKLTDKGMSLALMSDVRQSAAWWP